MRILILSIYVALISLACYKDNDDTNKLSFLEANVQARDGDYYPFLSHISLVRKDIFNYTTYVYNISKIDSVSFNRISKSRHKFESYIFNPYKVSIKYKDGSIIDFTALCQETLGNNKVIKPDVLYNQLDSINKNNSITIQRINKAYIEYNPYCGSSIYKWQYRVKDDSNEYTIPITSLCNSTLPFIQIFK